MTVPGFPQFLTDLEVRLLDFLKTQQFITDVAVLTATDAAVLATANLNALTTETGAASFGSEVIDIISQFAATATDMAPSKRREFMSDYRALVTSAAKETATAPAKTSAAGNAAGPARMDLLFVTGAVAVLIVAVVVAL